MKKFNLLYVIAIWALLPVLSLAQNVALFPATGSAADTLKSSWDQCFQNAFQKTHPSAQFQVNPERYPLRGRPEQSDRCPDQACIKGMAEELGMEYLVGVRMTGLGTKSRPMVLGEVLLNAVATGKVEKSSSFRMQGRDMQITDSLCQRIVGELRFYMSRRDSIRQNTVGTPDSLMMQASELDKKEKYVRSPFELRVGVGGGRSYGLAGFRLDAVWNTPGNWGFGAFVPLGIFPLSDLADGLAYGGGLEVFFPGEYLRFGSQFFYQYREYEIEVRRSSSKGDADESLIAFGAFLDWDSKKLGGLSFQIGVGLGYQTSMDTEKKLFNEDPEKKWVPDGQIGLFYPF